MKWGGSTEEICSTGHLDLMGHPSIFSLLINPGSIITAIFGLMKIIPLSEGAFTVDATKKFVPFHVGQDAMTDRSRGSLLVEIQPFVVITDNDIILLDTGLGQKNEQGQFQLFKNLSEHGLNADDITKVIMSHLHKDHASGLINPYTGQLSFENATHYIQKQELEYALQGGSVSYHTEMLELLKSADNVVLSEAEQGTLGEGIRYEITGAHSKFHRVIWIEDGDEIAFFGGDDAPQLSQMRTRFAAKYDFDGKKAMQLREKWLKEGAEGGWKFLFYHDIKTPIHQFNE